MSQLSPLTTELVEKQPRTAARVLAGMQPEDTAAFLEILPARQAATLFAAISAWTASRFLQLMPAVSGAAILNQIDFQISASVMRVMDVEHREPLLDALPNGLARDLKIALAYPNDTVGAHMISRILMLSASASVADACGELRQLKARSIGRVFVINAKREFLGVVDADTLLRHDLTTPLSDLLSDDLPVLSARARIESVQDVGAWEVHAHLPVVNRQKLLIGALSRSTLRDLAGVPIDQVGAREESSLAGDMIGAFVAGSAGLLQLLAGTATDRQSNLGEDRQS